MLDAWRHEWKKYDQVKWPWYQAVLGSITSRFPGKWASWQITREFARHSLAPLTLLWAEPYLGFWVILNGWYEKEGVQFGFCEILRKPKTKRDCQVLARTYLRAWKKYAAEDIDTASKEIPENG